MDCKCGGWFFDANHPGQRPGFEAPVHSIEGVPESAHERIALNRKLAEAWGGDSSAHDAAMNAQAEYPEDCAACILRTKALPKPHSVAVA